MLMIPAVSSGMPLLDTIYNCEVLTMLKAMPSDCIDCVVTSPPYYGLRSYLPDGHDNKHLEIGLEQTPREFVDKLVRVFREIRRVLKPSGTCWLNLGDSYAGGAGRWGGYDDVYGKQATNKGSHSQGYSSDMPNVLNCLYTSIKEGVLFLRTTGTLAIAAQRNAVLKSDQLSPDLEFTRLFGVQRITFKQGNSYFSQVLNLLNHESDCIIAAPFRFIDPAHIEILLDEGDSWGIVIADVNLDLQPSLRVSVFADAAKSAQMPLTIKETAEPVTESIGNIEAIRDTVTTNPILESGTNINAVDKPITLRNTSLSDVKGLRDFSIREASNQHLTLSLFNGRINLRIGCVGQLYISNSFGSLMRYTEIYHKAQCEANTMRPKQELGIPDMVKRALMEDGWYCRSSIIWSKPNPMPESVKDRPTKAHEMVYLLTKAPSYWYDADAIRDPLAESSVKRYELANGRIGTYSNGDGFESDNPIADVNSPQYKRGQGRMQSRGNHVDHLVAPAHPNGANARSVWTIPTEPTPFAHFATFPTKLVERCIRSGCPAQICVECGKPYESQIEASGGTIGKGWTDHKRDLEAGMSQVKHSGGVGSAISENGQLYRRKFLGYQPTCTCNADTRPGVVLDPFGGSGTVGLVAREWGRRFLLCDLNPEYVKLAQSRLAVPFTLPMFA